MEPAASDPLVGERERADHRDQAKEEGISLPEPERGKRFLPLLIYKYMRGACLYGSYLT